MRLSDVAEVVRWNKSLVLDDSPEHIVFELSATKGKVELLPNDDIYERHAVLILKNKNIQYMLLAHLEMNMELIRHKYLQTMNFKLEDVKRIEISDYFAKMY